MKVTIKETEKKSEQLKFPCLMINRNKDVLIIATGENNGDLMGIALEHPAKGTMWRKDITGWTKRSFKPFEGEITLKND